MLVLSFGNGSVFCKCDHEGVINGLGKQLVCPASVLQTLVQQVACEQYVQFYCLHHKLHMCQDFGVPKTQIEVVAGVTR